MSRSYKHHSFAGKKDREMKKLFNRRLRRLLKSPDFEIKNSAYKKVNQSWDICDYCDNSSWSQFWKCTVDSWRKWRWQYGEKFPDQEESFKKWKKWYVNK